MKGRLANENGDLSRQLEDLESQVVSGDLGRRKSRRSSCLRARAHGFQNNLSRIKSQLTSQLEESRRTADEESRERQTAVGQFKNAQHEIEGMRDQLDEMEEGKADALRQLSKANAEVSQWTSRFESDALLKADELEDAK